MPMVKKTNNTEMVEREDLSSWSCCVAVAVSSFYSNNIIITFTPVRRSRRTRWNSDCI